MMSGDYHGAGVAHPLGQVSVQVHYAVAEEWYRVSTADVVLHDPEDHKPLYQALLGVLHRPEG